MKIEVGEFVRTKRGTIHKIERRDRDKHLLIDTAYLGARYFTYIEEKEDIVKHSKNIIDLIEVGDYVNGHLVVELSKNVYNQKLITTEVDGKDGAIRHHYLERSIKTIITKEQMASIEYKVEEDK